MALIPLRKSGNSHENVDPSAIQLSEEAIALANVQTSRVSKENPVKEVRLYGKIAPDERSLQSQTAHVEGRIESLAVDFTGETHLCRTNVGQLYTSGIIYGTTKELLEAIKMQQPALIKAARKKLQLWKMTDAQITAINNPAPPLLP